MNRDTIKLLLESYRPQDADDPIFAEALREVAADPELAAWFEEMQQFDGVMARKFLDLPVPSAAKNHILLGQQASAAAEGSRSHHRWWLGGALAALVVIGFTVLHFAPGRRNPLEPLATQAINFTGEMPALQFVCFDPTVVANWVNEQPGSRQIGLILPKPSQALSMGMIGSSVVDWNGHPVIMICLQNKGRMAMLYILSDRAAANALPDGATQTLQKANWVVQATKSNGQVRLLTTKGRSDDLNFPMPF